MPYIRQINRNYLDEQISELFETLVEFETDERDGCLNYAISSIMTALYDKKYVSLNAAIGVLECCKLELYRRIVAPYEDTKIIENGDVYS